MERILTYEYGKVRDIPLLRLEKVRQHHKEWMLRSDSKYPQNGDFRVSRLADSGDGHPSC